jgi:hypothetical protein
MTLVTRPDSFFDFRLTPAIIGLLSTHAVAGFRSVVSDISDVCGPAPARMIGQQLVPQELFIPHHRI